MSDLENGETRIIFFRQQRATVAPITLLVACQSSTMGLSLFKLVWLETVQDWATDSADDLYHRRAANYTDNRIANGAIPSVGLVGAVSARQAFAALLGL